MHYQFIYHSAKRDLTNFSFLRHTKFSGFIVSMHQSGTHWLKHMLACAIAKQYILPMPKYNHANDFIRGPKDPVVYSTVPCLGSSHTIPHPLLSSRVIRSFMNFPKYVVLVRDMRKTLASNYLKWKEYYNCDFSNYLRGKPHEIWWCIRFLNAWGRISDKFPQDTLIVKYEELCDDALFQLKRINDFFELELDEESIKYGILKSNRENISEKSDPKNLVGSGVVGRHNIKHEDLFSNGDRDYLYSECARLLKYSFGYNY